MPKHEIITMKISWSNPQLLLFLAKFAFLHSFGFKMVPFMQTKDKIVLKSINIL